MDFLPLEIQSLIINNVKCSCLTVCKTWEKILKDNPPNNDLITHILNKDYYAIQLNCFNFPNKLKETDVDVAIIMNDSLIFKIILNAIYKRLPDTDSILMYFKIDKENSIIIEDIIDNILIKGNYKALQYFLDIHNKSGFPADLTYMSNISNIIVEIKGLNDYQLGHFMMIDYLMGDEEIEWCDDDFECVIEILSSSFDKFCDNLKSEQSKDSIKVIKLIDKLINKNQQGVKKKSRKKHNIINDKKAYLECIHHGLYNIIRSISTIEINNILIEGNELILFLLSLSGNCNIEDVIKFYNKHYDVNLIEGYANILNIKERYNEAIILIKHDIF